MIVFKGDKVSNVTRRRVYVGLGNTLKGQRKTKYQFKDGILNRIKT